MHLDERSAAYFALGLARASRQPVALLCTSGTAAANFMPAVVEANLSNVPLIVLTADRPPELREVGAAQTIDQIRMYGSHVKWFVEMATPGATEELLLYARVSACRAAATAVAAPRGPVHLNFPFREPLMPVAAPAEIPTDISTTAMFGRPDGSPYVVVPAALPAMAPAQVIEEVARQIISTQEGLIVCGPLDDPELAGAVAMLAAYARYPILADPLSGLRAFSSQPPAVLIEQLDTHVDHAAAPPGQAVTEVSSGIAYGAADRQFVVDAYDAILRDAKAIESLAPRLVLRFGAIPTSKPLLQYLQRHSKCRQIVVARGTWPDPSLLAAEMIDADPATFCHQLARLLMTSLPDCRDREWPHRWIDANRRAREVLSSELAAMDELFEGRVFAELANLLPAHATLWAGSSMPVRDLDTFFPAREHPIRFLANRGANGIDGVVSSALGAAAAGPGPTVLAIGDISFYHDMNGLLAAARHGLDLTIVLINNDGGGIFSFLPQATALHSAGDDATDHFELLFGTPHGLDFRHAAALYGATYTRVADWPHFRAAVQAGMANGGLHVVEVPTDRHRNVVLHRRCWPAVATALTGVLQGG
jgi:2-succinyl-5-enolpyruvyl-6-hydroxy-3-cyclohexene-1-carboxylate synthase